MTLLLYFWTFVWDFHWFLLSILTGKIDLTGSLIRCWNLPGTLLGFHWNVNNRWSVSVIKTIQLQVISPTHVGPLVWTCTLAESPNRHSFVLVSRMIPNHHSSHRSDDDDIHRQATTMTTMMKMMRTNLFHGNKWVCWICWRGRDLRQLWKPIWMNIDQGKGDSWMTT